VTDFLDANVILYSFSFELREREIAESRVQDALDGNGTISFQVVQEVLNVLIRRGWADGPERVRILQDVLVPLWSVMPSQELYELALSTQSRYRYSFYDSLIIAAALEAGCSRLYSEDMQDGQRIEGLTITNPFA
jgi:predicted nucleic acid-binding protein